MSASTAVRKRPSKPGITTAMTDLIAQVRQAIDFDISISRLCDGPCTDGSKKLLEFLDTELENWEQRLAPDEKPGLGDIQKLAKTNHKIHAVMKKNWLA